MVERLTHFTRPPVPLPAPSPNTHALHHMQARPRDHGSSLLSLYQLLVQCRCNLKATQLSLGLKSTPTHSLKIMSSVLQAPLK